MDGAAAQATSGLTEADRHALRIAVAATLSFAVAELLDWDFSFLGPLLSVQLLAASRQAPPWRSLVAVPILMLFSTGTALLVSVALEQAPLTLLMMVGLVFFLSFHAHRLGAPPLATLLVQIGFASVPLIAVSSAELAIGFVGGLFAAAVTAVITVWLAYAFMPAAPSPAGGGAARPTRTAEASSARVALLDTLVLLPLLVLFILGEDTNDVVILIVTITVLRSYAPGAGTRAALGLLIGNLIGGAAAALAYGFVSLTGSFVSFVLVLLASCLIFGDRIAKGAAKAPLFTIALATFILIFGMAVSPLPGGGAELFTTRLLKIAVAVLYVTGALALLDPSRAGRIPAAT